MATKKQASEYIQKQKWSPRWCTNQLPSLGNRTRQRHSDQSVQLDQCGGGIGRHTKWYHRPFVSRVRKEVLFPEQSVNISTSTSALTCTMCLWRVDHSAYSALICTSLAQGKTISTRTNEGKSVSNIPRSISRFVVARPTIVFTKGILKIFETFRREQCALEIIITPLPDKQGVYNHIFVQGKEKLTLGQYEQTHRCFPPEVGGYTWFQQNSDEVQ